MSRYLLTCDCGQSVPVERGQAGGHVACRCGRRLEVPTLRHLRELPVEESPSSAPRSSWSTRRGMVVALLAPAVALGLVSAYLRWSEPSAPPLDIEATHQQSLKDIDRLTPAEWYENWNYRYRPSMKHGFMVYQNRLNPVTALQVAQKRMIEKVLLSIAALLAAAALAVALWPAAGKQTRRHGDGETRRPRTKASR